MSKIFQSLKSVFVTGLVVCTIPGLSALGRTPATAPNTIEGAKLAFLTPLAHVDDQAEWDKRDELKNNWIQLPSWLAGTWCSADNMVLHDLTSKAPQMVPSINLRVMHIVVQGTQKDRLGRVWQYWGTPVTHTTEFANWTEEQLITKITVAKWAKSEFALNVCTEISDKDKKNGAVLQKIIERATITYRLIRDGEVRVTTDYRDMTPTGVFLGSRREQEDEVRMAPFSPTDSDPETNYRSKFVEFMKLHHPTDL